MLYMLCFYILPTKGPSFVFDYSMLMIRRTFFLRCRYWVDWCERTWNTSCRYTTTLHSPWCSTVALSLWHPVTKPLPDTLKYRLARFLHLLPGLLVYGWYRASCTLTLLPRFFYFTPGPILLFILHRDVLVSSARWVLVFFDFLFPLCTVIVLFYRRLQLSLFRSPLSLPIVLRFYRSRR